MPLRQLFLIRAHHGDLNTILRQTVARHTVTSGTQYTHTAHVTNGKLATRTILRKTVSIFLFQTPPNVILTGKLQIAHN